MTPTRFPEVFPLSEAPLDGMPVVSPSAVAKRNGDAVEVFIDVHGLPVHRFGATPDVVHVLLAEVNELEKWLAVLSGRLTVGVTPSGLEEWTLRGEVPATRRRGPVQVLVRALAVPGQSVRPSLRTAVAS